MSCGGTPKRSAMYGTSGIRMPNPSISMAQQQLPDADPVALPGEQAAVRSRRPSGTVDLEPGVPRPDSPPERLGQIARVALARGALEDQGEELRSARALKEVAHRDGAARVVSPLGDQRADRLVRPADPAV